MKFNSLYMVWDRLLSRPVRWLIWHLAYLQPRRRHIRKIWSGGVPLAPARRVAVLVHFSRRGIVEPYFRYLLRALGDAGFAVIVVSNARRLNPAAIEELLPDCSLLVHRRNRGYDFGAWRDGLSLIPELAALSHLLLVNDSIFGPLNDLGRVVDRCDFREADVWGITDSYFRYYHLQSYFLLFGAKAIGDRSFTDFFRKMRMTEQKPLIVEKYEIGLTRALLKGGLRVKALYPYTDLIETVIAGALAPERTEINVGVADYFEFLVQSVNRGVPLNPTHYFWEHLVGSLGCPFIKRDLLEKNPMNIPFLGRWRGVVAGGSTYPIEMIDDALQRTARNRVF